MITQSELKAKLHYDQHTGDSNTPKQKNNAPQSPRNDLPDDGFQDDIPF